MLNVIFNIRKDFRFNRSYSFYYVFKFFAVDFLVETYEVNYGSDYLPPEAAGHPKVVDFFGVEIIFLLQRFPVLFSVEEVASRYEGAKEYLLSGLVKRFEVLKDL